MKARKKRPRLHRLVRALRQPGTRPAAMRRVSRRLLSVLPGTTHPSSAKSRPRPGQGKAPAPKGASANDWSRLVKAVTGQEPDREAPGARPELTTELATRARRQRMEAVLAEAIGRGEPLERAVPATAAALADAGEWNAAWAIVEGVGRLPDGATASTLGHAVLLNRRQMFDRAWMRLRNFDDETLARLAPVEAVDAALGIGSEDARRRALAIAARCGVQDPDDLVDLAGRLLAVGERDEARNLIAVLKGRGADNGRLSERRLHTVRLMERWLDGAPPSVPDRAVPVAVLDYQTPDHTLISNNLGDYIQTLALLGTIGRLSNVTFTGEAGLGELATELQARVRATMRQPGVTGSIHLLPVNRDVSDADPVPEGTWMIAFGWHMHPLFHLRCDFPYHPNIRPLFISFHLYRLDMLSAEGLAYLRRYGPVGCRDWTTVDVLLGAGVDAFFTGCLTTTVDALFPERDDADVGGGAVGVIDLPASAAGRRAGDVRVFTHQYEDVRGMSVTDGIRAANERLGGYQRDLGRAVTNRLHAYLPLTSLGVPVQFAPANPGDVRFAGLTGLQPGDARLEAMRGGIRDLVEQAFGWILAGADEATVYGRWRELVGGRVAEAKSRFLEPVTRPVTTMDVRAAVSAARSGRRRFGPHDSVGGSVTDLVVAFDHTLLWPAAVLIESVIANATGPLRLWVLGRGVPATYQDWFAGAFPSLPVTFIQAPSHDPVDVGNSTMDLLLVPDILEDVDRVVYLAVDTLMLGDVCELATVDLGGRPLAARDTKVSEASEWRRVGHRLGEGPASDLRRSMGAQHGYGSPALNAGVLVMDLARMRRDGFTETALGGVERYGFSREDALLAYVGPERAALEARWNGLPAIEDVDDPCVIDWAGFDKPWEPRLTHGQARWRAYAAQLQARAGAPPGADLDGSVAPHPGLRTERRGGSHVVGA